MVNVALVEQVKKKVSSRNVSGFYTEIQYFNQRKFFEKKQGARFSRKVFQKFKNKNGFTYRKVVT